MSAPRVPGRPRPDASMTLLTEVMERPLDPGYAEAAARHASGTAPSRRRPVRVVGIVVLGALLGGMTTVAVRDLRAPHPGVVDARDVLVQEITARRESVESLTARAASASAEIDELQRETLATAQPGLLQTMELDGMHDGTVPVQGPGVVVSLRDGTQLGKDGDVDPDSRVRDADLQKVVNALWASGAEAISVDDQRLTSLSAIRNAGEAILVDLVPLAGPTYTVRAVGDADALQVGFARSDASTYLQLLGSRYGVQHSVVPQSSLDLPGAGPQTLRSARPVDSDAGSGGVTETPSPTEDDETGAPSPSTLEDEE